MKSDKIKPQARTQWRIGIASCLEAHCSFCSICSYCSEMIHNWCQILHNQSLHPSTFKLHLHLLSTTTTTSASVSSPIFISPSHLHSIQKGIIRKVHIRISIFTIISDDNHNIICIFSTFTPSRCKTDALVRKTKKYTDPKRKYHLRLPGESVDAGLNKNQAELGVLYTNAVEKAIQPTFVSMQFQRLYLYVC